MTVKLGDAKVGDKLIVIDNEDYDFIEGKEYEVVEVDENDGICGYKLLCDNSSSLWLSNTSLELPKKVSSTRKKVTFTKKEYDTLKNIKIEK